MATIGTIYHIDFVKLNPLQVVIVGTVLELSCFLFEIPTGVLADNYSRRLSMLVGLFLMGIGIFIEGSFPFFSIIILSQIIWGIGVTFLSGADIAWISDEVKEKNIDKILLRGAQIGQICMLVGMIISITIATHGINLPVQLSGFLFVLLGLFLAFVMPENNFAPEKRSEESRLKKLLHTSKSGFVYVRKSQILTIFFLILLFGGLYNEGFDRLWPFRFLKDFTLPAIKKIDPLYWFAIISAGAFIINMLFLEIVKRKIISRNPVFILWAMFCINLLLAAGIFAFAMAGNLFLALSAYWVTYTMRSSNSLLTGIIINKEITDSTIKATVFSIKGQVDQLGQLVGGPIIGFIAAKYSVSMGLLSSCFIILPILFLYLNLIKKHKSGYNS